MKLYHVTFDYVAGRRSQPVSTTFRASNHHVALRRASEYFQECNPRVKLQNVNYFSFRIQEVRHAIR